MAAISKTWVTIADTAVDPDSPLDTTLLEGIRDDLVHLREWVGASFFAGAVQDHNHDGANSALIEIGPNLIRNGSYESDGSGWTITDFTGGSHAFSTSTRHHGAKSLAFTSNSTCTHRHACTHRWPLIKTVFLLAPTMHRFLYLRDVVALLWKPAELLSNCGQVFLPLPLSIISSFLGPHHTLFPFLTFSRAILHYFVLYVCTLPAGFALIASY